jgi:hypothetical protein
MPLFGNKNGNNAVTDKDNTTSKRQSQTNEKPIEEANGDDSSDLNRRHSLFSFNRSTNKLDARKGTALHGARLGLEEAQKREKDALEKKRAADKALEVATKALKDAENKVKVLEKEATQE